MNRIVGVAWILLSLPVIGLAAKTALLDLTEQRAARRGRSWCLDCADGRDCDCLPAAA